MATTTSSKTFCFRTNRKLRFLRLLPFILLAILVISAVVFSVKVHKRLTRLSNQTQDLYQRDNSIHTLDVRLIHLADQIESLKHAQSKLESAHAVEIYSIQQSYHRDVERMRLTLKQYETAMEKLSERYALLEQANLELSLKMDLMQRRTSEALMEAKMQVEKVRDPVAMKKEMESIFESFLQKEILSLLNTRDSEKQKEDLQKETPKKGRRVNEKHYDRSVHHDEERLEVEKLNTRDPFYFDENEEVNKSQENYSSPIHDFIDTSYRFAKKGFETAKDYVYVHPRDDKKKIVIEVIDEVNPSDPFYFDENEEANRSQENYSSPIDDLIDTSYRFTKQGFETVKGYVKENGPKIVEKVEKVSKQNFEKVKDYVSETIPKVSAKLDDLGKKTQEFTEKTRRKMEAEAEKLAIKAKKAAKSIFDMVRN